MICILRNGREYQVIRCERCNQYMINVDAKDVDRQDLITLRAQNIRISNPNTEDHICIACHARHISDFYNKPRKQEDDSHEDTSSFSSMSGFFGGGGGGFGGFGGGMSAGGGASGGW